MRTIKRIHPATYRPIDDLISYTPLPSPSLPHCDPFLALNHYGPQRYIAENNGLPFGPHPLRGTEVVTAILEGDILHIDSSGNNNLIKAGGIQWITAGRGIIHSEESSEEFKEKGGYLEILQLWINLPAKYKMVGPRYFGLQNHQIPSIELNDLVKINLISGSWDHKTGPIESYSGTVMTLILLAAGGHLNINIPKEHNIIFYVVRGSMKVNDRQVNKMNLVEFESDHELLQISSDQSCLFLFAHAPPIKEPMVTNGPFVMNSEKEIHQAYRDYYRGKMGQL